MGRRCGESELIKQREGEMPVEMTFSVQKFSGVDLFLMSDSLGVSRKTLETVYDGEDYFEFSAGRIMVVAPDGGCVMVGQFRGLLLRRIGAGEFELRTMSATVCE